MKKFRLIFVWMIIFPGLMCAQHYLTGGVGFSLSFLESEDLKNFTSTYNQVNEPGLEKYLNGLTGDAAGLAFAFGFRYISKWTISFEIGRDEIIKKDAARFGIGEERHLTLKLQSNTVTLGVGRTFGKMFLQGVATYHFARRVTLKSSYTRLSGEPPKKSLTGTYRSSDNTSTDLGVEIGVLRKPFILVGKISYPLHTGGRKDYLRSFDTIKIENQTDLFPGDFWEYVDQTHYRGVGSDIDGLKVMITLLLSFSI
ncbi:MAG: hypothetical protein D6748_02830 [Calditrichaeota bacterium]|nr:MAG: hypothetical protein D6748_02830 [Calditrichota bacterium]